MGSDGGKQEHPCIGTRGRQLNDQVKHWSLRITDSQSPVCSNMFPVSTFSPKPSLVAQTGCPCSITLSNLRYLLPNDSGRNS